MKMLFTAAAAAAALLATAGAASAQDVDFSFNAALTSDYVFRGFSQTNEDPAFQVGADVTYGSFYAGAWASGVDFGDTTDVEADLYGGYRTEVSGFAVDLGVIAYLYTNAPSSADYNYIETKAAVSRAIGPVTAGVALYYSPDFFGPNKDDQALYSEVNASWAPIDKVTVSGAVGFQAVEQVDDYTTWNLGVSYALASTVSLDVRYFDTDVDSPISEDRIVGTIKTVF